MKTILVFLALLLMLRVVAQTDKNDFFQGLKGGMIIGVAGSNNFSKSEKPFEMGYCLLANTTLITPVTYHNLMYGFGDNSLKFLSGYLLPKDFDVYAVYSKCLNANDHYLGIGLERLIKSGHDNFGCFLFGELGTDLKGGQVLTIGVLISAQNDLLKKK